MIQKKIILLLAILFITITNAQSISFTSATLTKGLIGNTIQVDYEYTIGAPGYIYCAIENQQQNFAFVSTVASGELNPAPAGTSLTGSFFLTIPTNTVPFYDLPNGSDAVQTKYRIKIQLSDSGFVYQDGKFPGDWIELTNFSSFTGTTDSNWATASNWNVDVPNATTHVTIPASQNAVISSTTGANTNNLTVNAAGSLTINAGGSIKVAGTSTGNITYNVNVSDTNWHLVSSPVNGEQYDDTWITNNDIASGSDFANNRGISTYDNSSLTSPNIAGSGGYWRYFQGGATAQTFGTGVGYALIKDANPGISAGNFSFTGTVPTAVSPAINQGVNNWNLIGNSYPSYLDVAAFITANGTGGSSVLSDAFQAIYVYNGTTYVETTTGYVQPGQAFFVNSKVNPGNASITAAMQSHQTGVAFLKSAHPSIKLSVSNGKTSKKTTLNYLEGKTKSLDAGFDLGLFDGVQSDIRIYSELLEKNQNISFARQALPNSNYENMIVPIGIKANIGEIVFSAEALNLPSGIKVFLEDKFTNTFTRLDVANSEYKVTLSASENGVGRFYLHTKQSVLNIDNQVLTAINIYKTNASTIRITGLSQEKAIFSLFNILGKQVLNTSFQFNSVKDISLPKLATGIYFANVQTKNGKLSKKIILE